MKINIYLKSSPQQPVSYDMRLEEFKRLSIDFQKYLQAGEPVSGIYMGYQFVSKDDQTVKELTPITLTFKDISLIG